MSKDMSAPNLTSPPEWAVIAIGPLLATTLRTLQNKEALPLEKTVHGIGCVICGIAIAGYLRFELDWGPWQVLAISILTTPVAFSLAVVTGDESMALGRKLFKLISQKAIDKISSLGGESKPAKKE